MRNVLCICLLVSGSVLLGSGIEVNGGFEAGESLGWTEWQAPWSQGFVYDYALGADPDPFDGQYSLSMVASQGSFGVYQEFCVEPGVPLSLSWARWGRSGVNGWWEVLIIDGPYTYDRADNPDVLIPEEMVAKWEQGFGGAYPEPSEDWVEGDAGMTPTSDVVTVVLKCGSTDGPVEAGFDNVFLTHDTDLLELTAVEPSTGALAGGDTIIVSGRNLTADSVITLGTEELVDHVRLSTCQISGTTPPGEAGAVDVTVTTDRGTATLPGGFTYVGAPTVDSITPNVGPVEGGTAITISGTNFEPQGEVSIAVQVGGRPLEGLVVVDATTITGTTPAGDPGAADVVVTTPFGEVTVAGGFTYESVGPIFRRGDSNRDGAMNIADAVYVLQNLFAQGPPILCPDAADSNDDESVNIADAVYTLQNLFAQGPAIPLPHPDCGLDETPNPTGGEELPPCDYCAEACQDPPVPCP